MTSGLIAERLTVPFVRVTKEEFPEYVKEEREEGCFYDRGSRGYRSFYSDFHGDVWRDGLLIGVTGWDVIDKRREFELEILNL